MVIIRFCTSSFTGIPFSWTYSFEPERFYLSGGRLADALGLAVVGIQLF
jgi:hypothetical protein